MSTEQQIKQEIQPTGENNLEQNVSKSFDMGSIGEQLSDPVFEAKPMKIGNTDRFEQFANEMLSGWKEYKKIKTRMELLDSSCKKYMIDNNMKIYECSSGALNILTQNRRIVNQELIEEIEKYKVDKVVNIMYKSPN